MVKKVVLILITLFFFGELLYSESLKKDSLVTFRIINGQTGAILAGLETVFSVSSTDSILIKNNISDTAVTSTNSGSIDLQLIKSIVYRANVTFLKNGLSVSNGVEAPDGKYYLIPRETILFTPPVDLRTFVDFILTPSKSLLDVSVVDDKGRGVESGYVQAYAKAAIGSEGRLKEHVVGDRLVGGKVTLPVLPNRAYRVSLSAPSPDFVSGGAGCHRWKWALRCKASIEVRSALHSYYRTDRG